MFCLTYEDGCIAKSKVSIELVIFRIWDETYSNNFRVLASSFKGRN